MALESLFIRVTNATTGTILLDDVNFGLSREGAYRVRRPGAVYVPASDSVEIALDSSVLLSYESGAIRQQVDAGNLTVSLVGGSVSVQTYTWDFANDGGSTGAYSLYDIAGTDTKTLPIGTMLRGWVEIITTPVSGGTPTGIIGTPANDDGFVEAVADITAWTAGTIIPFNGALVANGLIDLTATANQIAAVATKNLTNTTVQFTLGGAALTAGKFNVHIEMLAAFS